jgi:hypothetical protein
VAQLEELTRGAAIRGILPDAPVTVVDVAWYGSNCVEQRQRADGRRN